MKIHPIFHNSLLKPYYETKKHGPNHKKPTPEIVNDKEGHYEINSILMAWPTQNKRSTQYLIKWKGYLASENSQLPEKELTTVQISFPHHVCRGLSNAFQAKPLKSKQESGVNMLILRFSDFGHLFQFLGPIFVLRHPSRTRNRDSINDLIAYLAINEAQHVLYSAHSQGSIKSFNRLCKQHGGTSVYVGQPRIDDGSRPGMSKLGKQ